MAKRENNCTEFLREWVSFLIKEENVTMTNRDFGEGLVPAVSPSARGNNCQRTVLPTILSTIPKERDNYF